MGKEDSLYPRAEAEYFRNWKENWDKGAADS